MTAYKSKSINPKSQLFVQQNISKCHKTSKSITLPDIQGYDFCSGIGTLNSFISFSMILTTNLMFTRKKDRLFKWQMRLSKYKLLSYFCGRGADVD